MDREAEIFALWQTNPQEGFRRLVDAYQERLYWHVRRLLVSHDDAEDAVQEAFIRIYKGLSGLRDGRTLTSWVYRIATNEALRIAERRPTPAISLDDVNIDVADTEYFDFTDAEANLLAKAIHSLSPRQQMAFNLRYYDEMDYDRIAEIMECSPITAKTTYHHAKNKIENYLKEAI